MSVNTLQLDCPLGVVILTTPSYSSFQSTLNSLNSIVFWSILRYQPISDVKRGQIFEVEDKILASRPACPRGLNITATYVICLWSVVVLTVIASSLITQPSLGAALSVAPRPSVCPSVPPIISKQESHRNF